MSDLAYRSWRQPSLSPGEPPARDEEERIVREARERFRQITDWEADFRQQFVADVRFANADADNHWQWPDDLWQGRDDQNRPSLTVNKTRQHCLQIINDAAMNKPEIKINPVSDEATKESAEIFQGICRHIEYASNATTAYQTATEHQVQGGIGWWRIDTDWEHENSFQQAIFIRRIKDAMSVYLDPDCKEVDGSDARYAFVVDDVPRDKFELKYPEYAEFIPDIGFGMIDGGWVDEDHVRVAEYFRKSQEPDVLHQLPDGTSLRESELATAAMRMQLRATAIRSRDILSDKVEKFLIVGGRIVDHGEWAGIYIPLVRVIGEEAIVEGRLERKGHVRALKDPQRIYNYWTSAGVESVALQSKTPWVAAAESVENFQQVWDTANTENHAVLPFNARDDAGQPLPPPQRTDPPQMGQAYVQGIQIAQNEMMLVSGQYQPTMGQPSPQMETSGRAIALRQRAGDISTYHYIDNLATAIRFTGRILIDLIPKIYDTRRVLKILNVDGSIDRVQLDPSAPQALTSVEAPTAPQQFGPQPTPQQLMQQATLRIFNPNIGRYEVQADVGPNYQTRRQEAFNAFTQVIQSAPQMLNIAGDLLFKAADFPMAEELAERLQRMLPPQALGQGPTPAEAQLTQQLQAAQAHVALLGERLAVAEMKLKGRDEQKDIDAYEAVTDRLGTLLNAEKTDSAYASGMELRALIRSMVNDALQSGGMAGVRAAAAEDMAQQAAMGPNLMGGPGGPPPNPMQGHPAQLAALAPGRPPTLPGTLVGR